MIFSVQRDLITIVIITSVLCAFLSPFLVMRKNVYMSNISCKGALFGVAIGSFISESLSSPIIIILGAITGFIGIIIAQNIEKREVPSKISSYTTIGAFFLAIGILFLGMVPDINFMSAIFGETALIPLYRITLLTKDFGPVGIYELIIVLIIVIVCIILFYKDLKLLLLDENYAVSLHTNKNYISVLLPALTALTVGVSIQTSGIIMTGAFLLIPAAIAYFYTKRLSMMMTVSVIVAIIVAIVGYNVSYTYNFSTPGFIVCILGIILVISAILAPGKGIICLYLKNKKTNDNIRETIIIKDLMNKDAEEYIFDYHNLNVISLRLNMKKETVKSIIDKLKISGVIIIEEDMVSLTQSGITKYKNEF